MRLSRLDLQRPRVDSSTSPYYFISPQPGWGFNPAAAGPPYVGMGCPGGCPGAVGVDEPAPADTGTPGWLGYAALAAAGGIIFGLAIGYAAGQSAPRGRRYRSNPGKVISMAKRRKYRIPKGSRPGSGVRFRALTKHLATRSGTTRTGRSRKVRSPRALAAWIGRRKYDTKYGKGTFARMAAAGRRRSTRRRMRAAA